MSKLKLKLSHKGKAKAQSALEQSAQTNGAGMISGVDDTDLMEGESELANQHEFWGPGDLTETAGKPPQPSLEAKTGNSAGYEPLEVTAAYPGAKKDVTDAEPEDDLVPNDIQKPQPYARPEPALPDLIGPNRAAADWEGRDVFVGFPAYKATNPATAWCLLALALDYRKEKIRFDMELGDAMIYHARNRLAMKFLETDATWLLFVDDDMLFPIGRATMIRRLARLPDSYPDAPLALQTVDRLKESGNWLVGGTYYTRNGTGIPVNSLARDSNYTRAARSFENQLFPCDWMGTGLMLVHRNVFLKMQAEMPELAPKREDQPWNFFQPGEDGRGEDMAFCKRAKELSIQPYVDARLHALHVGYGVYGVHTAIV
jgi:hypothetical protein